VADGSVCDVHAWLRTLPASLSRCSGGQWQMVLRLTAFTLDCTLAGAVRAMQCVNAQLQFGVDVCLERWVKYSVCRSLARTWITFAECVGYFVNTEIASYLLKDL